MHKAKRKPFSEAVETEILLTSRRRCALCFGLHGDISKKAGQIAHIEDPSNVTFQNAAFLCLLHHAEYDSNSRQTKGYTPGELKRYKDMLTEALNAPEAFLGMASAGHTHTTKSHGVSLDVYDRRLPIYQKTIEFLRTSLKGQELADLQKALTFSADTDAALFLFDEKIAEYLAEIFKRALRLRAIGLMLHPEAPDDKTPLLSREQADLMVWFSDQFEEARDRFTPFLRITDTGLPPKDGGRRKA